jgi:hypothetical protein
MLREGYAMALIQSKAGATGGEDGAGPVTTETDCNRDVPEALWLPQLPRIRHNGACAARFPQIRPLLFRSAQIPGGLGGVVRPKDRQAYPPGRNGVSARPRLFVSMARMHPDSGAAASAAPSSQIRAVVT